MNKFTRWLFSCLAVSLFSFCIGLIQPNLFDLSVVVDPGKSMSIVSAAPDCPPFILPGSFSEPIPITCSPPEFIYEDYVVGNNHRFSVWKRTKNQQGEVVWKGWMLQLDKAHPKIQNCWQEYSRFKNLRIQCLINELPLDAHWQGPLELHTMTALPGYGELYCYNAVVNEPQTQLKQTICRADGRYVRTVAIQNGSINWNQKSAWKKQ